MISGNVVVRTVVGAVAVLMLACCIGMGGYLVGRGVSPVCAQPRYTMHQVKGAAVLCADDAAVMVVTAKQAKRVEGPCPRGG